MSWVGAAASLAGGVMGAAGDQQTAAAQAQANEYNARLTLAQAKADEELIRRNADTQMGQSRAAISKSGVTMEGTPLLVMAESAANEEMDVLNNRWAAQGTANLYRMGADNAVTAGRIGAGSSLLAGIGGAFGSKF
jgi:hypothetical protein